MVEPDTLWATIR